LLFFYHSYYLDIIIVDIIVDIIVVDIIVVYCGLDVCMISMNTTESLSLGISI